MSISAFALENNYRVKKAMASNMLSELIHVRKETIRNSMSVYDHEEHRLEEVLKINGVQYINDSRAENVNAAYFALDSMEMPFVWIAGGINHNNDYDSLMPLVREKVKAIICLGEYNYGLIQTFGNVVDIMIEVHSMEEAVQIAYRLTGKGDAVLLSPAGEAGNMFADYMERGVKFKQAVRNL
jgi:UDP-N-acetylmuramoylalanine--D-glutamate ligase